MARLGIERDCHSRHTEAICRDVQACLKGSCQPPSADQMSSRPHQRMGVGEAERGELGVEVAILKNGEGGVIRQVGVIQQATLT